MSSFAALNKACIKTLGSSVSYQPAASDAFTVNGIFQRDTDEERHQDGLYARLFVNLADFAERPEHGDEATIDGMTYTVFEVLTDPTGGAWLSLRVRS
jgi:hypothetical protein